MDYYSPFRGPRASSTTDDARGAFTCPSSTLIVLANSDPFRGLLLTVLAPKRFPRLLNPGVRLRVSHEQSQYWLILAHFMDYYSLFPGAFTYPSSILTLLANSDPFRGLLLTVLDPEAISIVVEPQGALMYRSSKLIVFADSGPFLGLLLTVSGSRSDFHN